MKILKLTFLLLTLACGASAQAAIAFVQKLSSTVLATSSPTQSVAFTTNPTIGNRLICTVASFAASTSTISITDTSSNTWATDKALESNQFSDFEKITILSAPVTATGASFKVTISSSGTTPEYFADCAEFSGIATGTYLDKSASNTAAGGSTSLTVGPTSTLAGAGELIMGGVAAESLSTNNHISDPAAITGPTLSTAATTLATNQDFDTVQGGQFSYAIASSTTAASVVWTYDSASGSSTIQYVGAFTSYIPAAGGAAATQQKLSLLGVGP